MPSALRGAQFSSLLSSNCLHKFYAGCSRDVSRSDKVSMLGFFPQRVPESATHKIARLFREIVYTSVFGCASGRMKGETVPINLSNWCLKVGVMLVLRCMWGEVLYVYNVPKSCSQQNVGKKWQSKPEREQPRRPISEILISDLVREVRNPFSLVHGLAKKHSHMSMRPRQKGQLDKCVSCHACLYIYIYVL